MKNTIRELWNGELYPMSICGVGNSEITRLETLMIEQRERLEEMLKGEEKEAFKKHSAHMDELISAKEEQAFCDGFSLGMKIIAEALIFSLDARRSRPSHLRNRQISEIGRAHV